MNWPLLFFNFKFALYATQWYFLKWANITSIKKVCRSVKGCGKNFAMKCFVFLRCTCSALYCSYFGRLFLWNTQGKWYCFDTCDDSTSGESCIYRAVLFKWEFFIQMTDAISQPSLDIEESYFSKNVLFFYENDLSFYYL